METSEQLDKLFEAMAKTQSEMPAIFKTNKFSGKETKYAAIEDLWNTVRPIASKYGLSDIWAEEEFEDGKRVLIGRLAHTSGQFIIARNIIIGDPANPRDFPSAKSKLRRRMYKDFFGIVECDEDDYELKNEKGEAYPQVSITTSEKKSYIENTDTITPNQLGYLKKMCSQIPALENEILEKYGVSSLERLSKSMASEIISEQKRSE